MSPCIDRASRADGRYGRLGDPSGFTLVEVLVAFAVMTTVFALLYRCTVQSRAGAADFARRMRDEAIILSVLGEFRDRRDLADGRYGGERDGRHWTLVASRIDLAAQLPQAGGEPFDEEQGAAPPARPAWTMQRLLLRIDTSGRSPDAEVLHLVRSPAGAEPP